MWIGFQHCNQNPMIHKMLSHLKKLPEGEKDILIFCPTGVTRNEFLVPKKLSLLKERINKWKIILQI